MKQVVQKNFSLFIAFITDTPLSYMIDYWFY